MPQRLLAQKDMSVCEVSKFKSGQKSLSICWDKDKHWGQAVIYNIKGDSTRFWHLRKVAGHASVDVKFHQNGAVSEVNYSSHPDGGIQWYKEWARFNENGDFIEKREEKYPFQTYTTYDLREDENAFKPVPFTQIILKNEGKKIIYLFVTDTLKPPQSQQYFTLKPGTSTHMLKVKVHGHHPGLLNQYLIYRTKRENSPAGARQLNPIVVKQVKNTDQLLQLQVILK